MGSEGSHNTQNDTPLAPTMKNEIFQEQYEKLFETLHETRRTQTRELVAPVDINHHLGAPQQGGSPPFNMGIPDEERANHQNIDQHETSLNLDVSTRSRRSGGRHLLAEGLEGSKAINDPKVSKRLEEHEGTGNSKLIEEVNKLKAERQAEIPDWNQPRSGPLIRKILDTPFKRRQNKSLVYDSVLEGRTQLNTLTSLSPPWHIGCTPMKSDVFSSPPPSLAEL
ncbi:hypothetical protein ACFX16_035189 [Malus domestica]